MSQAQNARSTPSPADIYDTFFVPALFRQWGEIVCDAAGVGPGHRVLDVACGTGVLAGAAAARVGAGGAVAGLDPNEEMLTVARRKPGGIEWKTGRAESIPYPDATFDRIVSQFGFMFFEDHVRALGEMIRALRPQGRLALAVCDALDHSPGYAVLAELLERLFGHDVADAFRAPFALGNRTQLLSLCREAGIGRPEVRRHDGWVRFDSIAALISTERACVWTLGGVLDDAQFERLLEEAEESLRPFAAADGTVSFVMPALIVTAERE